jgi:hypothetical protein
MFINDFQSNLKEKAKRLNFEPNGFKVSKELEKLYEDMKGSMSKIVKNLDEINKLKIIKNKEDPYDQNNEINKSHMIASTDGYVNIRSLYTYKPTRSQNDSSNQKLLSYNLIIEMSIKICKEMVNFYTISFELLQHMLIECFKDDFYENIEKMEYFFNFLNKILKLTTAFDILKIKNPTIFSEYSESKLKNNEYLNFNVDELEDNKICILNMISLPAGRLFLSFFSSSVFDLEHPLFLAKPIKIHLGIVSLKTISFFIYLSEIYDWQYVLIYFIPLFYRLTCDDPFAKNVKQKAYSEMLKKHA